MPAFANQARGGEVLVKCCAPLAVPGAESLRGAALPLARRVGEKTREWDWPHLEWGAARGPSHRGPLPGDFDWPPSTG